jgi:hypothetical protein
MPNGAHRPECRSAGKARWLHERKKMSQVYTLLVVLVLIGGCAGAVAPPRSPGRAADPGVSWRISTGSPSGDADDVCSSDSGGRCIIEPSTSASPRIAAVSVYLHPGHLPATFSGAVLIEFVEGPDDSLGYELSLRDYRVDPDEKPPAVASAGLVTSVPGEYDVRVALLARTPGRTDPYQISLTIPVRVVPPGPA